MTSLLFKVKTRALHSGEGTPAASDADPFLTAAWDRGGDPHSDAQVCKHLSHEECQMLFPRRNGDFLSKALSLFYCPHAVMHFPMKNHTRLANECTGHCCSGQTAPAAERPARPDAPSVCRAVRAVSALALCFIVVEKGLVFLSEG